ncbi:hypothetical protein KEM52_002021 [Ascosphaera acerosa]|nr:hypothetical protein KEM52_002021 [Ascosphaera acerosa]
MGVRRSPRLGGSTAPATPEMPGWLRRRHAASKRAGGVDGDDDDDEEEEEMEGKDGDDDDDDNTEKDTITPATSDYSLTSLDDEQEDVRTGNSNADRPPAAITTACEPSTAATTTTTTTLPTKTPRTRTPSPEGLIPLHERYRRFVHRHEIPRKVLHVSIGFVTLNFWRLGVQTAAITPWLLGALVPVAALDAARHRAPRLNALYVRCVGALMRQSEVRGWNGVVWYLAGAWAALRWFPKDVGVLAVLLLSWCDTAASTAGRAWGRRTPQLRRGKSLAGSAAALATGVATAAAFWGWFVPRVGAFPDESSGTNTRGTCMFQGRLAVPGTAVVLGGGAALAVVSLWAGLVAAASELVDLFGWDDNLTIPLLSALGVWW